MYKSWDAKKPLPNFKVLLSTPMQQNFTLCSKLFEKTLLQVIWYLFIWSNRKRKHPYLRGLNFWDKVWWFFFRLLSSKFRVRQAPEEDRRTYRPKRCGNNKDEDNSPKTLNDKNPYLRFELQSTSPIFTTIPFMPWEASIFFYFLLLLIKHLKREHLQTLN